MRLERRRLLALAGAAATAGLAGCSGDGEDDDVAANGDDENDDGTDGDDGDGDPLEFPEYSRWLVTDDDGGFVYGYLDWAALEAADEPADEPFAQEELETDPMLGYPFVGAMAVSTALGFGLAGFGLNGLLEEDAEFETRVEELLFVGETSVVTGEVDVEEVDAVLTEASSVSPAYEGTEEIAGYDVYTSETDERSAIAVGADVLVFAVDADEPVEVLRSALEAAEGDGERAIDESEEIAWLVATGGDGDMALGFSGDLDDLEDEEAVDDEEADGLSWDELEDADGIVASLAVPGATGTDGSFAALVSDPDEAALEELLGATAEEGSVTVDGDRVSATATW